jgi:hypothetical protein
MKNLRIISILLCAGLLLGFTAHEYRAVYYAHQERARVEYLKKKWGSGTFTEIPASASGMASLLPPTLFLSITNGLLNNEMQSELCQAIARMLCCFSTGDQRAYQAFHFPIDTEKFGRFHPGRMAIIRNAARQAAMESKFCMPENASAEEVFTAWGFYQATQPPFKVCTNCWRKVNVQDIRLQVRLLTHTNEPSLHDLARQFEPLQGTSLFKSAVTYEPSCQALLDAGEPVVFACARIPVQMKRGILGVYPVYASFYWSDAHAKWIPSEMALPSTEGAIRVWF